MLINSGSVSTKQSHRLPLQPLVEVMRLATISEFADAIGKTRRTVYRMKASGLSLWEADRLAVQRAGLHPFFVWGDAWLEAIADAMGLEDAA